MKLKNTFVLVVLTLIHMFSCLIYAQSISGCYQPPYTPFKICYGTEGLSVSSELSVSTQIGTFSIEGNVPLLKKEEAIFLVQDERTNKEFAYKIKNGNKIVSVSANDELEIKAVNIGFKNIVIKIYSKNNKVGTLFINDKANKPDKWEQAYEISKDYLLDEINPIKSHPMYKLKKIYDWWNE